MTDNRITIEEMEELFGEHMPLEAAIVLWRPPDGWTVEQIRGKLQEIAQEQRTDIQVKRRSKLEDNSDGA